MLKQYKDDDLVYVDPDKREIIGVVEWDNGQPKSMKYPRGEDGRNAWRKFFPWGTYRSMDNVWLKRGGRAEERGNADISDALPKMLRDEI